jgi:multidrug resistance efflux pump
VGAAHALARVERIGARRALLLPVFEGERAAAVVALLYTGETGPDLGGEGGEVLADTLGEALAIQQRAHPGLLRRLGNWAAGLAMAVVGRTAWRLKVVAALLAAGLVVAAMVPSGHRPGFSARVEAAERRVVSAPFDGFIAEAPHQLGDAIAAGDLVVAMEDADLRLRLEETRSELAEISAELQAARAQRDQAQVRLLEARRAQAEVRRDLIARQLELSRFRARRDAVVVGGDAWRRLGDRVRLGEPLLELAEAESFRVRAFVDEDWVADVPADATGEVLLTAYPERPIPVRLAQVGSDPVDRDGVNTFPVRFEFAEPPDMRVLDGMRGIVRVDVGERSVLAAYSRGAVRWIKRTLWRWG